MITTVGHWCLSTLMVGVANWPYNVRSFTVALACSNMGPWQSLCPLYGIVACLLLGDLNVLKCMKIQCWHSEFISQICINLPRGVRIKWGSTVVWEQKRMCSATSRDWLYRTVGLYKQHQRPYLFGLSFWAFVVHHISDWKFLLVKISFTKHS